MLGNFSRFIRPGYKRISLDFSPLGETEGGFLLGSAWLSPDENEVVAVFVNLSAAQRKVDLSMASGDPGEIRAYVTDRSRNLKLDTSLQDLHNLELPARSVVTVVVGMEDETVINRLTPYPSRNGREVYDLAGRKLVNSSTCQLVNSLKKGIYIKQGKKYIK